MKRFNNEELIAEITAYEQPDLDGSSGLDYTCNNTKAFLEQLEYNLVVTRIKADLQESLTNSDKERMLMLLERNQALARAVTSIEARRILIQYNRQYTEKFKIPLPIHPSDQQNFAFDSLQRLANCASIKHNNEEQMKSLLDDTGADSAIGWHPGTMHSYPVMRKIFKSDPEQLQEQNTNTVLGKRTREETDEPRVVKRHVRYTSNPA